ncbi:phosphodiester glycosidase family protein [Streptomyces sp. 8L]|uniref:phosphodiester glycosidase family protein n=1 Tax=Streptomyces sp. 8L TaxID=2877242 RepID=UPI001CD69CB0|nr:phosphodiester glycosidase family protein [Streptomyces sp. 8L]MCA1220020.1 phosphodiester glycosidase family protein [Streptomyces sp. 8L]
MAPLAELSARGIHAPSVQSLARDQSPFARPTPAWTRRLAPGIVLTARPIDLGGGRLTNAYTLTVDLDRAECRPVSRPEGFHLRSLVTGPAVAAVSGAFAYISDDTAYQPAEHCLDLAVRDHTATSLPTATKPALLIHHGRPVVHTLAATGTLTAAGRPHTWTGSKAPSPHPSPPGHLTVFGAANCRIRYHDDPRTGFRRDVDPAANTTPRDPAVLDCTVNPTPTGAQITALHPGGADLFTGAYVLRARQPWPAHLVPGAPIHITTIDTLDTADISSALSLGPSAADAAAGHTTAWDQSLGTSPFRPDARYARTLLALDDRRLTLTVLDGAPLAPAFQGVTVQETAELCEGAGHDSASVFHLDGGQTSKIAYRHGPGPADAVGSLHYLRWPRHEHEAFRWQGLDGRRLHSALQITSNQEFR